MYLGGHGQFPHAFIWSHVRDLWWFSQWIRERNRECAPNFVPILGKVLQRSSQWFNKPSGSKAWVVHRCFNGMPGSRPVTQELTMTNTQGDPQAAQLLKLLDEFKSSSIRINVGPFTILLSRWELVTGHANGFRRKNWACTMLQPNLCPGSWKLTRSSSASTPALNFISSPPITLDNKFQKIFCICDEYVINLFVCIYEVWKGT